jgi:hypothetical protein
MEGSRTMAIARVRHDTDLGHIVIEHVGGTVTHLDAKDLAVGDDFDIWEDEVGAYSLSGGKNSKKVADSKTVTADPLPNPAVTHHDLTGKARADLPVPGQHDKGHAGGDGSVPGPILTKSAIGQGATEPEVDAALAKDKGK